LELLPQAIADLHGDQQRDRNNIQKANVLTEKGEVVKGFGDMPNEHDMMSGSDSDGRAFPGGFDTTCNNWTSDGTDHRSLQVPTRLSLFSGPWQTALAERRDVVASPRASRRNDREPKDGCGVR
jgi:hypothetical protein